MSSLKWADGLEGMETGEKEFSDFESATNFVDDITDGFTDVVMFYSEKSVMGWVVRWIRNAQEEIDFEARR